MGRAPGDVLRARRGPSCVYEVLMGRSILQQHTSLPADPNAGLPRSPRPPRVRGAPERGWVPLTSPRSLGTPPPPSGDPIPRHLPARRALLAAVRQSHDLMEQLFLSPPPAMSSRPGGERSPARGSQSHPCALDRPWGSLGGLGSPQWWPEGGSVPRASAGRRAVAGEGGGGAALAQHVCAIGTTCDGVAQPLRATTGRGHRPCGIAGLGSPAAPRGMGRRDAP